MTEHERDWEQAIDCERLKVHTYFRDFENNGEYANKNDDLLNRQFLKCDLRHNTGTLA